MSPAAMHKAGSANFLKVILSTLFALWLIKFNLNASTPSADALLSNATFTVSAPGLRPDELVLTVIRSCQLHSWHMEQ
jgi:hypothetical protein